jgi:hypothetical protein
MTPKVQPKRVAGTSPRYRPVVPKGAAEPMPGRRRPRARVAATPPVTAHTYGRATARLLKAAKPKTVAAGWRPSAKPGYLARKQRGR